MACLVSGRGIGRQPETDAARPNDTHTTVTPLRAAHSVLPDQSPYDPTARAAPP